MDSIIDLYLSFPTRKLEGSIQRFNINGSWRITGGEICTVLNVLIDEVNIQTAEVLRLRQQFARLANQLTSEHEKAKAIEVVQKCIHLMPVDLYPHTIQTFRLIDAAFWLMIIPMLKTFEGICTTMCSKTSVF